MLVALKPLYDLVGIEIIVSTYQAVSGTGKEAIEELAGQTARLLNGQSIENKVYPKQIASMFCLILILFKKMVTQKKK